jgi:hypothetical protein
MPGRQDDEDMDSTVGVWAPVAPQEVVTDDAATLRAAFDSDSVTLCFTDWRGERVCVVFSEVAAFRWLDFSAAGVECTSGALHIVDDSRWVAEMESAGRLAGRDCAVVHVQTDFDLLGVFDVVCASVTASVYEQPE